MSQPPSPAPQGGVPVRSSGLPQWPVLRKKQTFVVPIVAIVVGVLVMAIALLATLVTTPINGLLGLLLSGGAAIVLILLLTWLDRWEPEPPHLLLAAFFWGGGVSLVIVLLVSPLLQVIGGDGEFFAAAISAPLVEESAKGLFLLVALLATRRGRAEFNSLTDALVYAGFIGVGFSFVEHMLYIAQNETFGESVAVGVLRIGLTAWMHSIYTAMTAIGLWLGVTSRGTMRFVYPVLGWSVAVLLHFMQNGSIFLGIGGFFGYVLLVELPAFIALVVLAVRSYRREGEVVREQLPALVHNGWVTPLEADWLGNVPSRKRALAFARTQGKQELRRVAAFRDHVTELAHVRHRLDRTGPPFSPDLVRQHDHLVELLQADKLWVAQHLQPAPQHWQRTPVAPPAWQTAHPMPDDDPPIDPDATRLR
ncbi:MAG TPA: PrsW family intramembrane metalloprotease [Propionibacterium sp.]|jgi:RsiW-degrading membrane proteinase PrsW (M82 family)|nr:PrsW family intramembrane metalloprotease [Propionibacterium sp.]